MQTFASTNFKLRPMNIYRDCFINKLYYKMLINKLIAFLRKDTFFVLFHETQPNIVVKTNKYDFDYIYIYHQFLLSLLRIWYFSPVVLQYPSGISCVKGQKMAQTDKTFYLLRPVSQEPDIFHLWYTYVKEWYLQCGKIEKNDPKWQSQNVTHTPYCNKHTSHGFWYICVKWWHIQMPFSFFLNFDFPCC